MSMVALIAVALSPRGTGAAPPPPDGPRPLVIVVTGLVQCGDQLHVACYWPIYDEERNGVIIIGTGGWAWYRHELRHHLDYLDDGRVNGSLLGCFGDFEACAGPGNLTAAPFWEARYAHQR